MSMNNLKALSLTFENASIEVREYVALSENEIKQLLSHFSETFGLDEAIIISTCNRTEFFYLSDEVISPKIFYSLKYVLNRETEKIEDKFFEVNDHAKAVERLFEVSVGIHSQVVGDTQITNQIKNAYQWSADMEMAGPFLHRIMHTIFFANKRVVQETSLRDGAASIAYVTKELIEEIGHQLYKPSVLIIGTGEIGTDVLDNLKNSDYEIFIANRTDTTAEFLAEKYGFRSMPFERAVEFALDKADIVVTSLNVKEHFIKNIDLQGRNFDTHKYFIDLSVPAAIDRKLADTESFILYNIDELNSKTDETWEQRIRSLEPAREIIKEAISDFNDWTKEMVVSPTIKKLKDALEEIRKEELNRYLKKASDPELKLIEKVTKSMMQKVIKLPVLNLKAACKRGEAETLVDVLNDLFDLEKKTTGK